MRPLEIESWALRILERVEARLAVEDSRVELKAEWPKDPNKAARRIAGHANAARGEIILWLVGVDEKQGAVTGATYQDLANWFGQVKSCFESEIPTLQDLNITYKTKTVTALIFDTSRFPYLVRNPSFGKVAGEGVEFEVPWREGTKTRSATRSELILLLSPLTKKPKIEILQAQMTFFSVNPKYGTDYLEFVVRCYITPLDSFALTIPLHKCKAVLKVDNSPVVIDGFKVNLIPSPAAAEETVGAMAARGAIIKGDFVGAVTHRFMDTGAIARTSDELIIRGPGKIDVVGEVRGISVVTWPEVHLEISLIETVTDMNLPLSTSLVKRSPKEDEFVWVRKG